MMSTNINFKGYENVLAAIYTHPNGDKFAHISMQLNDSNGYNDATKYKELLKLQGYDSTLRNSDIITLSYYMSAKNKQHCIFLGDRQLFTGEELKRVSKTSNISTFEYQQEEKLHLKAYTILASITKRLGQEPLKATPKLNMVMENTESLKETPKLNMVRENMFRILCKITGNQFFANDMLMSACKDKNQYGIAAKMFNRAIVQTMAAFFK